MSDNFFFGVVDLDNSQVFHLVKYGDKQALCNANYDEELLSDLQVRICNECRKIMDSRYPSGKIRKPV